MAEHRHKRDTDARRFFATLLSARPGAAKKVSAGLAVMATTSVVAVGVLSANPVTGLVAADVVPGPLAATLSASDDQAQLSDRFTVSRSSSRKVSHQDKKELVKEARADGALAATALAVRKAEQKGTKLWTTAELNLWTQSGADAVQVGEIAASRQVLVTGRQAGDRVEIVVAGKSRWVTDGYLSEDKPLGVGAGLSMAPCPDPGVESGLTSNAVYVYRSVCHAFPQITSYGGWDNHGEHSSGRALDIMTSDVTLGTAIADFLRAHASELHIYDILWRQHIWTPVRAGEGWRLFASRGSATANHYDHVHVSVY